MVRPTRFEISEAIRGSAALLSLTGELDMQTTETLARRIDGSLEQQPTALILDLRELAFMDSSGLRFLIELNERAQSDGWRLTLIAPRHEAAKIILRTTGAETALPFEPEIEA